MNRILFGHTAICTDPDNFIDVVFNYAFDFKHRILCQFAKGDLEYLLPIPTLILSTNIPMKRSVYEQELLINDSAKQRLFDNLITSARLR
jgi:hypothetical protein